jgi:AcrR family transcriptional regulator
MPRPKSLSDKDVLDAALEIMRAKGPDAATFAAVSEACGLSTATLVQRFGSKPNLVQRTIVHAWDKLDILTAKLASATPRTPQGAINLLVGLSSQYGDIDSYAEGLLLLREDLRDRRFRARGVKWKAFLYSVLDECFAEWDGPEPIGLLIACHWQGSLNWWAFDPEMPVEEFVEDGLNCFVSVLLQKAQIEPDYVGRDQGKFT